MRRKDNKGYLLDVAVAVHHETVAAKMVLHVEMHDIKYGLGFTYHEFSEIMHRVYAESCSFNKDYTNGLHPNSDGVRRPPCKYRTKSKNVLQNKN